jgi:flagellar hook-associated protein 2
VSTVSFSGVGSGNDWSTLISQLVAAEKIPATTLTSHKTDAQAQSTVVGSLVSALRDMATQAQNYTISSSSIWSNSTSSSDSTRVVATSNGSAATGSYSVKVNALAQSETRLGKAYLSNTAGAAGAGTIKIGVGTGAQASVDYLATDTLADIAARINSNVPGVTAAAIYDGSKYHLTLSGTATGQTNTLNISDIGTGLGLETAGSVVQPSSDASVTMNGITATSSSNQIADLIPGVTLNLQSMTPVGGSAALVSVARDSGAVATKIQDLITSYNKVASLVHTQNTYTGTTMGQDTLFGDPILSSLQREMGTSLSDSYVHGTGGNTVSARDLGITMNTDGTLSLNQDTLKAKITSDPTAVQDLLTGPSGLAKSLASLSDRYALSSGPLLMRQQALSDSMKRYDTQITEINDRATALQVRLKAQFAALDALMAQFSASSSALTSLSNNSSSSG